MSEKRQELASGETIGKVRPIRSDSHMRLPNASIAILDIAKLAQYCLSEQHPLGRHKARVFKAALFYIVEFSDEEGGTLSVATLPATALQLHG